MHWYVMIFEFSVFFMFYPQENKKRKDGPLGSLLDEDWSGSLFEEDWGGSVWNHRPLPSTLRWWSKSTLFAPVPPLTHSSTDKLILGSKIKKSQGGLGRNLEKTPHHILNSESHYDNIPVWYCPSLLALVKTTKHIWAFNGLSRIGVCSMPSSIGTSALQCTAVETRPSPCNQSTTTWQFWLPWLPSPLSSLHPILGNITLVFCSLIKLPPICSLNQHNLFPNMLHLAFLHIEPDLARGLSENPCTRK